MPGINIHELANVQNGIAVSSSANLIVPCGTAQTVFCHVTATTSLAGVWEGTYAQYPSTSEANADWFDVPALKVDDAAVIETLPAGTITPDDDDVMAVTTMGATVVRFRRTAGSGTVSFSVSNASLNEILAASTRSKLREVALTLTLDTVQYSSGDLLSDTQTLAAVVSGNDVMGYLVGVKLVDEDNQAAAAMEIVLMDQVATVGTFNDAVAITDALSRNILGIVTVAAGDWIATGNGKIATLTMQNTELPLPITPASGTDDIGVCFITRGTPTQVNGGIKARFYFQDCV